MNSISTMKSVCLLLIILSLTGCSIGTATYTAHKKDYSEFEFRFQKGMWPNTYNLRIANNSQNRTVSFSGNSEDHYILTTDGYNIPLDVSFFNGIGMKGMYWLLPNSKGQIPYNIPSRDLQNAEKIIFKGTVYIAKYEGALMTPTDRRAITITYYFKTNRIEANIGTEILSEPKYSLFLINEQSEQVNEDYLEKDIAIDEFRLRGGNLRN